MFSGRTCLARPWQQQGQKEDAQQMLAEIYGWFTEGFDTKDVQEAEKLLKELTWDRRSSFKRIAACFSFHTSCGDLH
jgi:hypothetical protein